MSVHERAQMLEQELTAMRAQKQQLWDAWNKAAGACQALEQLIQHEMTERHDPEHIVEPSPDSSDPLPDQGD